MPRLKRCSHCINRHVQCDGNKPICSRCQEEDHECAWPVAQRAPIVFLIENGYAHTNGAKRPRGPPKRGLHDSATHTVTEATSQIIPRHDDRAQTSSLDQATDESPPLTPQVKQTLFTLAANKYVHAFLRDAEGMTSALEGYIARYGFAQCTPSSLSRGALSAVMLIYFGLSENSLSARSLSLRVYEQALLATNNAIHSLNTPPSDDLLLAIMLLGAYEGRTGDRLELSDMPNTFHHVRGAVTLLALRQEQPTRSQQSRELDAVIWRRAVRIALQTSSHLDPVVRKSIKQQIEEDYILELLYILMGKLAETNADLHQTLLLQHDCLREIKLRLILESALSLDAEMVVLGSMISAHDQYRPEVMSSECNDAGALKSILRSYYGRLTYTSVHAAHQTTVFYGCWLRVKDIILSCISSIEIDNDSAQFDSVSELYRKSGRMMMEPLVRSIFSSVPFFFNDLEKPANTLDDVCANSNAARCAQAVFALHSILTLHNSSTEHRQIAGALLMLSGRSSANGILQALFGRLSVSP